MDLKELISYFFEKGLLGKRFLIAIGILLIWAYCVVVKGDAPDGVTNMVGMVAAFYLGAHQGMTGNATIEASSLLPYSTETAFVGSAQSETSKQAAEDTGSEEQKEAS